MGQFPKKDAMNDSTRFSRFDESSPTGLIGSGIYHGQATKTAEVTDPNSINPNMGRSAMNVLQSPSRRFYQPDLSSTAIMLPKTLKMVNRWCRWIFDHDELVETVLRYHSELPYSQFELECDDPFILRAFEDQVDQIKLFTKLPELNLEFLKVGEVFPYTPWDDSKGMYMHLEALNPDYVEVTYTPFANEGTVIELIPDDDLRKLINSTKPEDQAIKKRIPKDIMSRVLTGRNMPLKEHEITHIARRSNPYDVRGTSILRKVFRLYQYEDKLREAQMTIADNFIYPLKIFKLGDPATGWVPSKDHQNQLAQMLQQSNFDPNFSLIYHYALEVEYVTVADKVMSLANEWEEINKKKMIALGVSLAFMSGDSSFSSANVGLQTQLARYRATRDLFEFGLIKRLFRNFAEKNEYYTRDKREITNNFRVTRSAQEKAERLVMPEIMWHKKLVMREDQSYLAFLNNVNNQGKGPVSDITLLRAMGEDAEQEIKRKKKLRNMENRLGEKLRSSVAPGQAPGQAPAPGQATASFFQNIKAKFAKQETKETTAYEERTLAEPISSEDASLYIKASSDEEGIKTLMQLTKESTSSLDLIVDHIAFVSDAQWFENLKSPKVSSDIYILFTDLNSKLNLLRKKISTGFDIDDADIQNIFGVYKKLYLQGKLYAYSLFNNERFSSLEESSIYDYSDEALLGEFKEWVYSYQKSEDKEKYLKLLRSFGNTAFTYGQLRTYSINGVSHVKLSNVQMNKGMSYDIHTLLSHRYALSLIVSPKEEIIFLNPKIEYFKHFAPADLNIFLEDTNLYKSYSYASVNIKNAPVEYMSDLNLFLKIAGKYLPYKNIEFIDSIPSVGSWAKAAKANFEHEYRNIEDETERLHLVQTALYLEQVKVGSSQNFYVDDKVLYISKSVDAHDNMFIDKLFNSSPTIVVALEKSINSTFDKKFCDLTTEDINKLAALGVLEPIVDNFDNIQSYKVSSTAETSFNLDERVKIGKVWDVNGKALHSDTREPMDIFKTYFTNYVEFPQNMNKEISKLFAKVLGQ
jgi:hypothetical protein